jgi:hypothetical protein
MPIERSPGAPDALGATLSSGPHHARAAGEMKASRPDALQVSDLGDTFTPASEQLLIAASGDVSTRREPVVPVSGVEQTAVGTPSHSARGEPGRIQRFEVLRSSAPAAWASSTPPTTEELDRRARDQGRARRRDAGAQGRERG